MNKPSKLPRPLSSNIIHRLLHSFRENRPRIQLASSQVFDLRLNILYFIDFCYQTPNVLNGSIQELLLICRHTIIIKQRKLIFCMEIYRRKFPSLMIFPGKKFSFSLQNYWPGLMSDRMNLCEDDNHLISLCL